MNAYKEIEKLSNFQLESLKKILDALPIYEVVERDATTLVVRKEPKNCVCMEELVKEWEMVREKEGLIIFKKSEPTYEEKKYQS